MRFVTRERLHVDRIATAWALLRFVDAGATFAFVPRTKDLRGSSDTPFDIPGAHLSHRGERCTFEVLLEEHELRDPALLRMGRIVRGADLPHDDGLPPESDGVRAVFDALRDSSMSDVERLAVGRAFCDGLYAHCRSTADRQATAQ